MTRGRRYAPALVTWALVVSIVGGCASLGFESPDSLMKEGQQLYADKKYDEAIQDARLAIERKPDCPGVCNVVARAYFAADRWQESAALVERAIEVNGDDYNLYIPLHKSSSVSDSRKPEMSIA